MLDFRGILDKPFLSNYFHVQKTVCLLQSLGREQTIFYTYQETPLLVLFFRVGYFSNANIFPKQICFYLIGLCDRVGKAIALDAEGVRSNR